MSSATESRIRYLRDRCVNAYWMLRNGKFRLIVKSVFIEIEYRIAEVRTFLSKPKALDDSQVPASAYVNLRKVIPPSYRPTQSQPPLSEPLKVDSQVVANELQRILAAIAFEEDSD